MSTSLHLGSLLGGSKEPKQKAREVLIGAFRVGNWFFYQAARKRGPAGLHFVWSGQFFARADPGSEIRCRSGGSKNSNHFGDSVSSFSFKPGLL